MPPSTATPASSDLQQAIKDTAWHQIAQFGAPALSLRAIARQLGITAPAIYNYFHRRDDLVTALIKDAYLSFGDAQASAILGLDPDNHRQLVIALGSAYRDWATSFPERYQLIFGTPIAGYHAPLAEVLPAASRSLSVLVAVLAAACRGGKLRRDETVPLSPNLQEMLKAGQSVHDVEEEILYLAIIIWSRVHGLVSLEIGQQYPVFIRDPGEIFRHELEMLCRQVLVN